MSTPTTNVRGAIGEGTVTPNRVWALVSLLRQFDDGLPRSQVEIAIMPDAGDPERDRATFNNNLREAKGAGLIVEEGERLKISPEAPAAVFDSTVPPALVLADAVFASPEGRNDALGYALAWFLDLDPYSPDVERQEPAIVAGMLNDEVDGLTRVTNDHTFGALEGWAVGLGFAHHSPLPPHALVPDPTAHLRARLPPLFSGERELLLSDVTTRLATLIPVLEGGRYRSAVGSPRKEGHLAKSSSIAWLRLENEGLVRLSQPSDADSIILEDASGFRSVSHVALTV